MANIDALQYDSMIGTYETVKETQLKGIDFYKAAVAPVDGDIAKWDEEALRRVADAELKSRGAPSGSKNLLNLRERSSNMAYFNESFLATGDDLNNLRQSGSNTKDVAGKSYLSKNLLALKNMERRTRERLLFSCLTGILGYTLNGIAVTVNMGTAGGNKPTAVVSWATATTDIVSDITAWKAIAEEASGRVITQAWINDTVAGYLLHNDSITAWLSGSSLAERILKTGQIGMIAGVNFTQYDGAYIDGAGAAKKFVPDDKVFFTPPADEGWLAYQEGSVSIVEDSEMIVVPTPGIWNQTISDPVGEKVLVKSCFLPVLVAPDSIIYADVTP